MTKSFVFLFFIKVSFLNRLSIEHGENFKALRAKTKETWVPKTKLVDA